MKHSKFAVIILAAGLGTRMKSDIAKVLHEINGKPMIVFVVETALAAVGSDIIVIVGYQAEKVKMVISEKYDVIYAYQRQQLGTGHAVQCALSCLTDYVENVIILCGDVPLLKSVTIHDMIKYHIDNKYDITVLAFKIKDPKGYGRLIVDRNGLVSAIVEESDASKDHKEINIVNSGVYCINKALLNIYINKIKPINAKKEMYLTDIVKIAYEDRKKTGVFISSNCDEFIGINSYEDLQCVESVFNKKT
mmetsp:Transcript_21556/g.10046  ORF Transcript_21556/g.10046 Transcript_21556/m.10046 type:complete len:249 (+) Transcript_21556:3813-4559(+)